MGCEILNKGENDQYLQHNSIFTEAAFGSYESQINTFDVSKTQKQSIIRRSLTFFCRLFFKGQSGAMRHKTTAKYAKCTCERKSAKY